MDFYKENLKNLPELNDLKKWIDAGNQNDFLESIFAQASKRILSDSQVNAAIKSFYKINNPPKKIEFDAQEQFVFRVILNHLSEISPQGYDFYNSLSMQIESKGWLTEKQWEAAKKKFHRFRKALLRRIFK